MINHYPPGRYRRQSSHRAAQFQNSHRPTPLASDDAWGDTHKFHQVETIRIAFQNIQGLPRFPYAEKHKQLRDLVDKLHCDFLGIAELNLHFSKLKSHEQWKERFRQFPRHHSIHSSNINFLHHHSPVLFGGVGQFSFNTLAHCAISSGNDPTGLGRWVWTKFQGRNASTLRIITGYRPNRDRTNATSTVFSQHQHFLLAHDDDRDPKRAFLEDLGTCIQSWQALGDLIV